MAHKLFDLVGLFDSLPVSSEEPGQTRFIARPVPGAPSCAVGKDSKGMPVLVIETNGSSPRRSPTPLVLENLSVLHDVDCRLQFSNANVETRRSSIVRCTDPERVLHEYFLRGITPVLMALPNTPTRQQVTTGIETLVALFSKASQVPCKTIMGLWAELFVIAMCRNPAILIRCWHALPGDRFDFADGTQRLEIKAAAGRIRSHRFALEQLRPPSSTRAVVVSVLIERAGAGETIVGLINSIREVMNDPELLIRLDNTIAQSLGSDWRQASTVGFDRQLALESLRYVDVRDIPSIPEAIPSEISDVHFRVDLTQQAFKPLGGFAKTEGLISSSLPVDTRT